MIKGLVQGVGFRPFVYRLANEYSLNGEVENSANGVIIAVDGEQEKIDRFREDILRFAPAAAQIKSIKIKPRAINGYRGFRISQSRNLENEITEISPDIAVCAECLSEIKSQPNRINYPLINCTNCGPRFTIIYGLPYDREKTSMCEFKMCNTCNSEYHDISNRRFHAQPIACNACGPEYQYLDRDRIVSNFDDILSLISSIIDKGKIIAIKGVGGYHLMCDALNEEVVVKLRERKHRDSKPFAVLFRDISSLKEYCQLDEEEVKLISSWRRPILLLQQKKPLAKSISNSLTTVGAMLPNMPIHYLLFERLKTPVVVMTSGNISDNPIIADDDRAAAGLMTIADALVSYNREICNRADDSVTRVINNKVSIIRRSRGYVPNPIDLNHDVDGIIALGAEQKNCFCIGKGKQAILSQHIGDLTSFETYSFYKESIERFYDLFRFKPKLITCDLHPNYLSTHYAMLLSKQYGIPILGVQHHHAHIASCMAEHHIDEKVIGVCFDGTGYGIDGNIWGGEFLIADLSEFKRYSHFEYAPLPGGDKVADEPWRMAISYLYKYYGNIFDFESVPSIANIEIGKRKFVLDMIAKGINSPLSSSAGRLFDAVSAITGLCSISTFDSEAPMRLESILDKNIIEYYPYLINSDSICFKETFKSIVNDLNKISVSEISSKFHNTISNLINEVSKHIRDEKGISKVVLTGGVFQNKYLTERTNEILTSSKFDVFTNQQAPANDGGIALGQLVAASKINGLCV